MADNRTIPGRPTRAEIDLGQLKRNYSALRSFLPPSVRIMAVVKADAYGHGAVAVARALEAVGVDHLAVAIPEEGIALRQAGVQAPILLLNGFWAGQEEAVLENHLTPVLFQAELVRTLRLAAKTRKEQISYHLKIDTGMTRLGAPWDSASTWLDELGGEASGECTGILSHFSTAEVPRDPGTLEQIERFRGVVRQFEQAGYAFSWTHLANSAGILNCPGSWFSAVRPGLLLYGVSPVEGTIPHGVAPALSWKTTIMQISRLDPGMTVGYGRTFRVSKPSLIATLPVGYADGLDRRLSNRGFVLIRGKRAPIVGRISMDLTTVDVTEIPSIGLGEETVLIGAQGAAEITAGEMAALTGTIPYEVFCRIGSRVPRICVEKPFEESLSAKAL